MGSNGWGDYEHPAHQVFIDGYWMDETPVTNRQFSEFVEDTGYLTEADRAGAAWGYRKDVYQSIRGLTCRDYSTIDRQEHPVVLVTWGDAVAYSRWAAKRLPTEAEWEKAARGNLTGKLYPWGDKWSEGRCNFAQKAAEIPPTNAVYHFVPNDYGLHDMVGNVWQWCADWYSNSYYSASEGLNPGGPNEGTLRVRRGGAWNVIQNFRLRCANRGAMSPSASSPNLGFRCVLDEAIR